MDKKKVGILTFHYVDNYGAVLQTWALREALNSFFGIQSEIINYVPANYRTYPYVRTYDGIAMMREKRKRYEDFLIKERLVAKPMIHSVCGNDYDCYVVGSDQVWNLDFRENITKEYLFPNLDGNARRISYAASIGGKISESNKEYFKKYLCKFDAISVRETNSVEELSDLGFRNVTTVLDPALLINMECYESLIEEPENKQKDFLLFFSYPMGDEVREWIPFINYVARRNNLRIIHSIVDAPKELFASESGCMLYEGIGEFLWYMKNASAVITTSYHGAIFGRIFNHPTYIIRRDIGWERMEQLCTILGLEDAIGCGDWLKHDWDISKFSAIDQLELWRDKSIDYLQKALCKR